MSGNFARHTVSLCLLLVLVSSGRALGDRWTDQRAAMRRDRVQLQQQADEDREARAANARQQVQTLIDKVKAGEVKVAKDELWQLVAGLCYLSPDSMGDLPKQVRALEGAGDETDKAGELALAQTKEAVTARPWELLQSASNIGYIGLASDFMWEVLYFDPDYEPIRRALGQKKIDPELVENLQLSEITGKLIEQVPELREHHPNRYWFSAFDAARIREGLWWDDRYGWMLAKFPQRYEKGYVYDLQRKMWTTLDEANAYHSKPGKDWQVQTEHLLIQGTADLQTLVTVADQLEAMYDEIFVTFAQFFTNSRRLDAMRFAFGLAEHQPLKVWVYATHDEYVKRANAVGWSGGVFRQSNGTAYFFGKPSQTMYHEFTHQVLHVMTGKNNSPTWLTEGVAVYAQTVRFDMRGAQFPGARPNDRWSVDQMMRLRSGKDWYRAVENAKRDGLDSPYGSCGSLVTFAMQYQDGLLQADFIDFLRDSYRQGTGKWAIWDYMGMGEPQFKYEYAKWLVGQ